MLKILVSQCLYGGIPVRYDGKSKELIHEDFIKWKKEGRLIPVCPEVIGGLPVPRSDAQRVGERIINRLGEDVTEEYAKGAREAVKMAEEEKIICAILKEKSPSCGSRIIYDGSFKGGLIEGEGLTTELLRKAGFKVFSENELGEVSDLITEMEGKNE